MKEGKLKLKKRKGEKKRGGKERVDPPSNTWKDINKSFARTISPGRLPSES